MRNNTFLVRLCLSVILFVPTGANAQVTVGCDNQPSEWSLLDLKENADGTATRGLHLPRLTTDERDALVSSASSQNAQDLARGLMIYNTDTRCLELWNSNRWVSFCAGDTPDPCGGFGTMNTFFCSPATIADLTQRAIEAGGNGTVRWFVALSGGDALDASEPLVNGIQYWADNCAGTSARIPVSVSLVDCTNRPAIGNITAWTNAMYDFQSQTLSVTGINTATSWQWQVSGDAYTWQDIAGATDVTFTIPADFIYDSGFLNRGTDGQTPQSVMESGGYLTRGLYFRVVRTNPVGTTNSGTLNMYFIRTNTSGFSTVNGVRTLDLSHAQAGRTTRVALLNLGATNDNSLGNFFQWGRVADGHEQIVWSKNANGANIFGSGTSGTVANSNVTMANVDTNGQVLSTAAGFGSFLSFLTGGSDWVTGDDISGRDDLWGNGTRGFRIRAGYPVSLSQWSSRGHANNPCAVLGFGWRVPSHYDFWDFYNGNGVSQPPVAGSFGHTVSGNTWYWRPAQSGAVGGAVIYNASGEALFLPAVGFRNGMTDAFNSTGTAGNYWSSTFDGVSTTYSFILWFNSSSVTGYSMGNRTHGMSVRCVAD